jgi:hypothetical protein
MRTLLAIALIGLVCIAGAFTTPNQTFRATRGKPDPNTVVTRELVVVRRYTVDPNGHLKLVWERPKQKDPNDNTLSVLFMFLRMASEQRPEGEGE